MTGCAAAAGEPLRVLSWNLWELRGDLRALVDVVRDLDPDVLLVQEAPRFVLPRARLRWLAGELGMRVLLHQRGMALLAAPDAAAQVIRRGRRDAPGQKPSVYPRGVAAARLSLPGGGEVVVAGTHLALDPEGRLRHARHLCDLVRGAGAPVILGGDLNETAAEPAVAELTRELSDPAAEEDAPTFPASRPRRRIDMILASRELRARSGVVTSTPGVSAERLAGASDHLPVLCTVEGISLRPTARG